VITDLNIDPSFLALKHLGLCTEEIPYRHLIRGGSSGRGPPIMPMREQKKR
jgi:hypothetical protein